MTCFYVNPGNSPGQAVRTGRNSAKRLSPQLYPVPCRVHGVCMCLVVPAYLPQLFLPLLPALQMPPSHLIQPHLFPSAHITLNYQNSCPQCPTALMTRPPNAIHPLITGALPHPAAPPTARVPLALRPPTPAAAPRCAAAPQSTAAHVPRRATTAPHRHASAVATPRPVGALPCAAAAAPAGAAGTARPCAPALLLHAAAHHCAVPAAAGPRPCPCADAPPLPHVGGPLRDAAVLWTACALRP